MRTILEASTIDSNARTPQIFEVLYSEGGADCTSSALNRDQPTESCDL